MVRVAINGYGRIGRVAHRVISQWYSQDIEIVAVNAGGSTDLTGWMYLLKYDSVYGAFPETLSVREDTSEPGLLGYLVVGEKEIPVFSQKDPALLPWGRLSVDVVIESTGAFLTAEKLEPHLVAGAKSVVLSAPAKGDEISTYVLSINQEEYQGERVISNASCTTNCITPVAKVMDQTFGIEKAMMTTIHAYTSDQRLLDGGHEDPRRARAAGVNIIPTTTGATKAAAKAYPPLEGRFDGLAIRVPVPVGSLSDFTFLLGRETTVEEVNEILAQACQSPSYEGVMVATTDPLVSSDIIGSPYSAIVDLSLTQVVGGNMVKVVAWYDNEYGYANRLIEQVLIVGGSQGGTQQTNATTS